MLILRNKGPHSTLEALSLLQGEQVLEVKAIESADNTGEIG